MTKHIPVLRLLYEIAFFIFALFYLPIFLMKGKHRGGLRQRFGIYSKAERERLKAEKVIWVHAVSVGEMVQALRLAQALKRRYPARIVLTATTVAGKELAEKFKSPEDTVLVFPVDFRFCVRSFLSVVRPQALIILETEIWPNLIFECSRRKIPIFIVNGRISDRAFGRYRLVRFLLKGFLNRLERLSAQDERMRSRFEELGIDATRVVVTGNMKFDWSPPANGQDVIEKIRAALVRPGIFLMIAGSTHPGEEEILFRVLQSLREREPGFRLLIAPRHLNRIESIEVSAARKGIVLEKVSAVLRGQTDSGRSPAVFLLDEMGILANVYALADLVFIGGSLVPVGGHNLVEPAFFEKPILFGPFMHNFQAMAEVFKKENACLEVKDPGELEEAILALMGDPARRHALGREAKKIIDTHRGATEKNIELILRSLGV